MDSLTPAFVGAVIAGILVQLASYRQFSDMAAVGSTRRGWGPALLATLLVQVLGIPIAVLLATVTGSTLAAMSGAAVGAVVALSIVYRGVTSGIILFLLSTVAGIAVGVLGGIAEGLPLLVALGWNGWLLVRPRRSPLAAS